MKYRWLVLRLLPGEERPSYAGLRVDVLKRADGEPLIRYQGQAADLQENLPPSSALWGAVTGCSPCPGLQEVADRVASSHLDEAQRERLATLETSARKQRPGQRARLSQFATSCTGRGRLANKPGGRRCNRPRSRGFNSEPSPGTWAWRATPWESTPGPSAHLPNGSASRSVPRPGLWLHH